MYLGSDLGSNRRTAKICPDLEIEITHGRNLKQQKLETKITQGCNLKQPNQRPKGATKICPNLETEITHCRNSKQPKLEIEITHCCNLKQPKLEQFWSQKLQAQPEDTSRDHNVVLVSIRDQKQRSPVETDDFSLNQRPKVAVSI